MGVQEVQIKVVAELGPGGGRSPSSEAASLLFTSHVCAIHKSCITLLYRL